MSESTAKPFGAIALALSGGGYRAAAFHLGLLRTLFEIKLLDDVTILSTVSGGTFLGAAYAVARSAGQSCDEFFNRFRERLRTQRPVHRAAELLVSDWNKKLPRCTLIAAQAEAIDEQFFEGCRFGELFDHPTHLEEITFNATDFRTGLPFRFQKSRSTRVKIGNGKHAIPLELAKQLRIADVVAASSCFPGGFEPLGFPHDFHWLERADALQQLRGFSEDSPFAEPIPLMDGGVADNQGLGSLLAAIERRKPEEGQVGLVLISDADQASTRPLLEHWRDPRPTGLRVSTVLLLARVLAWVGVIASVLLGWRLLTMFATRSFGSWFFFVETVFSLLVILSTVGALSWASRVFRKFIWDRVPRDAGIDIVGTVEQTTVSWLGELLWMRLESLFAMSNSVFMKGMRDLRYRDLFSDDRYRGRVVANLIYDLAAPRRRAGAGQLEPSPELRRIAERTRDVPTCLWFDNTQQLDEAILCGRFTACFNLLRHIKELPPERSESLREVSGRLEDLWRELEAEVANTTAAAHSIQPPPSTRSAA